LIGLFKKVVIADGVARYATPVFDAAAQGAAITTWDAWTAALAYTYQLYFDFSGYSDMAIGLALMFGIQLPFNFNSPYKAASIIDFWRRWHITLSTFLRDYLYIPLGGNRYGESRRLVNLMTTMLLGGLWHGAGWTFVAWGGLHGFYLVLNHLWRSHAGVAEKMAARGLGWLYGGASTALTFLAVVIAWVFFRAANFETASTILKAMAGFGDHASLPADAPAKATILILLTVVVMTLPNSQETVSGRILARRSAILFPILGVAAFASLMLLGAPSEFLYFRV
jgi:D-alanyl-lipoteichoic acid acyltransferase DltB (MBOAT superfamily)